MSDYLSVHPYDINFFNFQLLQNTARSAHKLTTHDCPEESVIYEAIQNSRCPDPYCPTSSQELLRVMSPDLPEMFHLRF